MRFESSAKHVFFFKFSDKLGAEEGIHDRLSANFLVSLSFSVHFHQ
jgi:hypothetical protein